MKQQTLAMAADDNAQYEQYRRPTRRDAFPATTEQIVPWAALCAVIEPHYPKAGNGRPPVGLERMLRMYFRQGRGRRLRVCLRCRICEALEGGRRLDRMPSTRSPGDPGRLIAVRS